MGMGRDGRNESTRAVLDYEGGEGIREEDGVNRRGEQKKKVHDT